MKYARPQQVEVSPPVHLSLDHLQPVDLPFRLPVAPLSGERGRDRLAVAPQPGGKALELCHTATLSLVEPTGQCPRTPLLHHPAEPPRQPPRHFDLRA